MSNDKKITFEEAFLALEKATNSLKEEKITLEEALRNFEDGIKHYNLCNEILTDAKQKIEVYSK